MIAGGEAASGETIARGIAEVDDAATFFWKERKGGSGEKKNGGGGAVEACEPVGGLSAEDRGGAVGSSVVKEEVDASKSFLDTVDEAIDLGGDGEVGADDFGGGALLAKLVGQAESGGGAATMVEDESVSH